MSTSPNPLRRISPAEARRAVRGTAILPALIVVVMVATLSMIFVQISLSKNKEQRTSVDAKRAFYMAEAGLAEGFNGLCLGKSGNVASEVVPAEFGHGLFWTIATELGSGRVTLESTGLCGAGRATLSLTCERRSENIGALGFFGGRDIKIEAGALIDSYDSRLGTYASQALLAAVALPGARVGGNQDITVQGTLLRPTFIFGDTNPGPLGTLLSPALGVTITGSKAPSPATVTFPLVKPPSIAGHANVDVTSNRVLPSGAYGIDKLKVKKGVTLTLNGPMAIVADEFEVEDRGGLIINATDGPVKIYVLDKMRLRDNSTLNSVSNDPLGITFQVGGGANAAPEVELRGSGDFHGSIYSPLSDVELPAGLTVYGSVVAGSLKIKSGGKLHFDRAFTSTDDPNGASHLLGWHIVELPNVPAVTLRYDALAELIRSGVTPVQASQGHFDLGVVPH